MSDRYFGGKYRKRPVVVEAMRFIFTPAMSKPLADFLPDGIAPQWTVGDDPTMLGGDRVVLRIPTLEGEMIADEGDWIIKGVNGEFYPCKDDIFVKTYVSVDCSNCYYMVQHEDESKWPERCGACGMPTTKLAEPDTTVQELMGVLDLKAVGVQRYGDHVDLYFIGTDESDHRQRVLRVFDDGRVEVTVVREMGPNYQMGER